MRDKSPLEMGFDDFVSWATGHILFGIGRGETLRSLVWIVVEQAARNTVFGGKRQ